MPALAAQAARDAAGNVRWFFLTDAEAAFLTAAVDRLIPEDGDPSASQVGVVDYIDLQLATGWGNGDGLYLEGPFSAGSESQGYQLPYTPAELYRRAIGAIVESSDDTPFEMKTANEQDNYLTSLENGEVTLGDIPGDVFFAHLKGNTIEGYFADPIYNGNRNYAGWAMIGFPGAHAYYLTEVDRYNMAYLRPPSSVAHAPGRGAPEPFTGRQQTREDA